MNQVHRGHITDRKIVLDNRPRFQAVVDALEGREVEVVIRQFRNRRSLRQNAYYWSVVIKLIADHLGYEPEELHEALKRHFLGETVDQYGLKRVASTTELTTTDFIDEYTERIKRWASQEMGIYIPNPEEAE